MLLAVLLFIVGLVLICLGGDHFVDASVAIAEKLGIPQIVVGATIVSLGTTLPEVLVSTTAAFGGSAEIAAGNAFGSIICNTSLIAAVGLVAKPPKHVEPSSFNWRILFFSIICIFMIIVGKFTGRYNRITGIVLLGCFALYAVLTVILAKNESLQEEADGDISLLKAFITLVICAIMLFIGARLLVNNGIIIAEKLKVPQRVIAVTFIALGTSLPELVTTITSLIKGKGNVGLGNIIGANLLNLLLVIGIPATISGMELQQSTVNIDAPVGLLFMLILSVPILIKKKGYRLQGIILLIGYVIYCISSVAA